jgi:sulfur-carrier protein
VTSDPDAAVAEITVRYWAAARDAAGCASERLPGRTLADVIDACGERHGPELTRLLGICSYLVGAAPAKRAEAAEVRLESGTVVEVLPPFAGGSGVSAPWRDRIRE